jgi:hypothetical protein
VIVNPRTTDIPIIFRRNYKEFCYLMGLFYLTKKKQ